MVRYLLKKLIYFLQDIINDDELKLDWLFKASLTHDIVNVSVFSSLLLTVKSIVVTSRRNLAY